MLMSAAVRDGLRQYLEEGTEPVQDKVAAMCDAIADSAWIDRSGPELVDVAKWVSHSVPCECGEVCECIHATACAALAKAKGASDE